MYLYVIRHSWFLNLNTLTAWSNDVNTISLFSANILTLNTVFRNVTVPMAQKVHNDGIRVFAIGVGYQIQGRFLEELSGIGSDPDEDHVFKINDFSSLSFIEETLVRRTCREAPPG